LAIWNDPAKVSFILLSYVGYPTFQRLPLCGWAVKPKRSSVMQPEASKRPVVLIVEDETLLRLHVSEAIEDAGFDVVEAKNADDAISILEQRSDIFLIFTDVNMPGSMDGLKLAHFVKGRWPPIKIIATSGHAKVTADDLPAGGHFIPKPYRAAEIADAIHQLVSP
jgi:two-component system, response regulator PdtaR